LRRLGRASFAKELIIQPVALYRLGSADFFGVAYPIEASGFM
jgi:hypothetical protein